MYLFNSIRRQHSTLVAISKILKTVIICGVFFCCSIYKVQAKSFQNLTLTYSFDTSDDKARAAFGIDSTTGDLTLQNPLSYRFSPHQYNFNVTVKESYSNFMTTTTVCAKHNGSFVCNPVLCSFVCCNSFYKCCQCLFVQMVFTPSSKGQLETSM